MINNAFYTRTTELKQFSDKAFNDCSDCFVFCEKI